MKRNIISQWKGITIALILLLWLFPARITQADDIAMFELGNDLLQEQNYPKALEAYNSFVKENPEHRLIPAAKWTMANIYTTINKDYEKAAELLKKIVTENPKTDWEIYGYYHLGNCFEEQKKWEKAAQVYQPAIQKLSASGEDGVTQTRVRSLKRRLLSCYRNMNDHAGIIGIYREILTENPAASSANEDQFHLAQAYLEMNNPKEAAENFALVVERYPASNYAQRVQSEQTDLLASQLGYDWIPFSKFQTALRLSQTGHYQEASSKFNQIIKTKPNMGMVLGAKFQIQIVEYRKSGNAAALREKISTSSNEYPYGFGGVPIDRLNYFLQGIVQAQRTLASNPNDAGAYVQMGRCYYQTQAFYCGMDTLKKAVSILPDTPNLYNMLGYCYIGIQKYDEAISAFQKLIAIDPDNPNSYDSMAECHYIKGDTTTAIKLYNKSLAVDSSFSNPHYMLGRIYQELGRKKKAIEHLNKYLEFNSGGYQSQSARNRLSQLNPPSSTNKNN